MKFDIGWVKRFSNAALAKCLKHPIRKKAVLAGLPGVNVIIVSNWVIGKIHREFMGLDGATDVITFDHGEIIISAPMAQANATRFGKPLEHEIGLYIIHGLLHLNGYDDKTGQQARVMRKLQESILASCLASCLPPWIE